MPLHPMQHAPSGFRLDYVWAAFEMLVLYNIATALKLVETQLGCHS